MNNDNLLKEATDILIDIVRVGSFYYSAIEIDQHVKNPVDGEEFKIRINDFLKKVI